MYIKRLKSRLYATFEKHHHISRLIHNISFSQSRSVKLVAVARNEAAYLPEWIYHHLYFGFDKISIFYNNCSDNTVDLINTIEDKRVEFINADSTFHEATHSPQVAIYRQQFRIARQEGFSHLMFLDIDEFWTPGDLGSTISDYMHRLANYDIVSFNWMNKVDEDVEFCPVITQSTCTFEAAKPVKSLYKTFIYPKILNPHNVISTSLKYVRDVEGEYLPLNEEYSLLPQLTSSGLSDRAFVIHRKYRSEREYVALLGRGRPIGSDDRVSIFKDNRTGYGSLKKPVVLEFPAENFKKYNDYVQKRLSDKKIAEQIQIGRKKKLDEFDDVIKLIESAPQKEQSVLNKLMRNVKNPEARAAYRRFKRRHKLL